MRRWLPLLVLMAAPAGATTVVPPVPPSPAIGYDWVDPALPVETATQPDAWPRADETAEGVEDMIHDEQHLVGGDLAAAPRAGEPGGARLLRTLRKVGGDYVVVPVLTLHLR